MREMLAGADDSAPPRPGRWLETPQRLGILPTLNFWNRRDVWKSSRWFTTPVVGLSLIASALVYASVNPWLYPVVGLASGVPVALAHGLLERHIRGRLRDRRLPPPSPTKVLSPRSGSTC